MYTCTRHMHTFEYGPIFWHYCCIYTCKPANPLKRASQEDQNGLFILALDWTRPCEFKSGQSLVSVLVKCWDISLDFVTHIRGQILLVGVEDWTNVTILSPGVIIHIIQLWSQSVWNVFPHPLTFDLAMGCTLATRMSANTGKQSFEISHIWRGLLSRLSVTAMRRTWPLF
jgi:hypothetical protein